MKIKIGDLSILATNFESRRIFQEHFEGWSTVFGHPMLQVEAGDNASPSYWGIVLLQSQKSILGIGFPVSILYIEPIVVYVNGTNNRLILGFDNRVVIVRVVDAKLLANIGLESAVFDIMVSYDHELIIVVHDIGVYGLNYGGEIKWEVAIADMISDFELDGNTLLIQDQSGQKTDINILNGEH